MSVKVIDLEKYQQMLLSISPFRAKGRVVQVIGLTVEVEGLASQVGEICHIHPHESSPRISAEVVGFRNDRLLLMPFGEMRGIKPGSEVVASGRVFTIPVGEGLLGRVLDGFGKPIDGLGPLNFSEEYVLRDDSPSPLTRRMITEPLPTGVRAIDALLTCGKGQRMGIFAGSGVGKSTLMGMIARNSKSDVNVIALIGERGREVQDFINRDLGQEGLQRSVVVVSTSDQSSLLRIKGAWVATTIAEYFRDQGMDVTFMMDSVTRFAMAQREIGLAIGEPPAMKGYTPSVFALLPKLMERTGTAERGTITGFYTVLVESDDLTEPITDTVRSILDGHIVLSRDLAAENHYPPINVLGSVSRIMNTITLPQHRAAAGKLREVLATYQSARDLVNIGAYVAGSNPAIDYSLEMMPKVKGLLIQPSDESTAYEETTAWLEGLFPDDQEAQARPDRSKPAARR
ncbi:MAG: flagellar protein export ATPase FliI [Chloroflexi bacterium]|nr:flagellar protein export ATPase FliI [Chloroflexota bacterium]